MSPSPDPATEGIPNSGQTKAFTPELKTRCSSSTTIKVIHVLSPPLFHDPSSYKRYDRRHCTTIPLHQDIIHSLHLAVEVNHHICRDETLTESFEFPRTSSVPVRSRTSGLFDLPWQPPGQEEVRLLLHQNGLQPLLHPHELQPLPRCRAHPAIRPCGLPIPLQCSQDGLPREGGA